MSALVLSLSLGPTSTAIGLFRGGELLKSHTAEHLDDLAGRRVDQRGVRVRTIRAFLEDAGVVRGGLAAVAVRGGRLRPLEGGTYAVCEHLLRDAEQTLPGHPGNVGAAVAHLVAGEWGCPAFVVDPDSVDERETLARLVQPCTLEPPRPPALAVRAAARRHARAVRRPLESLRLVLAHLGESTSLCALRDGRMVDVVELWDERQPCPRGCGLVPPTALADLDASLGATTPVPLAASTLEEALARAEHGDARANLAVRAAAYRISRAVGELATVLDGEVDAILLTGPLAAAGLVVGEVCRRVEWIAPVFLYRGEDELQAIAEGALRVLLGEEAAKRYA